MKLTMSGHSYTVQQFFFKLGGGSLPEKPPEKWEELRKVEGVAIMKEVVDDRGGSPEDLMEHSNIKDNMKWETVERDAKICKDKELINKELEMRREFNEHGKFARDNRQEIAEARKKRVKMKGETDDEETFTMGEEKQVNEEVCSSEGNKYKEDMSNGWICIKSKWKKKKKTKKGVSCNMRVQ